MALDSPSVLRATPGGGGSSRQTAISVSLGRQGSGYHMAPPPTHSIFIIPSLVLPTVCLSVRLLSVCRTCDAVCITTLVMTSVDLGVDLDRLVEVDCAVV